MRRQDFINLDEVKFRVSFPGEIVTTKESIDKFAIEFAEWIVDYTFNGCYYNEVSELLEEFKKENGL